MHRCSLEEQTLQSLNGYEVESIINIWKRLGPEKPLLATGYEIVRVPGLRIFESPTIDPVKFVPYLLIGGFAVWTRGVEPDSDPIRETSADDTLVVADIPSLERVLERGREALIASNWPTDIDGFTRRIFDEHAAEYTPLYDVIADAYGDTNNPGRTEFLLD